jgi:hypothetical protein
VSKRFLTVRCCLSWRGRHVLISASMACMS